MRRGRAAFFQNGYERSGIGTRMEDATHWMLTNSLVRISPLTGAAGSLLLESWDPGGGWDPQPLDVMMGATTLSWLSATILRNSFEAVTIRLVSSLGSAGRILVDLTIRRGSRIVEGFIQSTFAGTLTVKTHASVTTANNAASGYIVATADTALGNRYTAGSPITFTGSLTGAISKVPVTSLAWYAGHVITGAGPAAGDSATDLRDQYVGMPSSVDVAVRR
jgi:hypothetical protein